MVRIGEIVHFVLADGPEAVHGTCRPAIVIATYHEPHAPCDLVVFRNGWNDRRVIKDGGDEALVDTVTDWRRQITHAVPKEFGRWHAMDECGVGV